MATNVRYNGVVIANCVTRHFDQTIEYDASGTDVIGVRYRITVEGYVHSQATASSTHGVQAVSLGGSAQLNFQFDNVSARLTESRRKLEVYWEGQPVLIVGPATGPQAGVNTDVNNGPRPISLEVLSVMPQAVRILWTVEAMISNCAASVGRTAASRIINNRWSISEVRDSDFYTTRTIHGTIRFAEGLSAKHALLAAVVPGLEQGFRRESIEYEVAANGLEATYRIIDRQVHYASPWPATHMDVQHHTSTNDGMTWIDEVHVTLVGSPEADRRQLLTRMIQIIDQRIDFLSRVQESDSAYLIENVIITEHFGEQNMVQAVVAIRHLAQGPRVVLGNILENKLGKPLQLPDYDATRSRQPALHGYNPQGGSNSVRSPEAFLFLLTCYYQDPCQQTKTLLGQRPPATPQTTQGQSASMPYPVQRQGGTLPQSMSGQSLTQNHYGAIYTFVRAVTQYEFGPLQVVLPALYGQQQSNQASGGSAQGSSFYQGATAVPLELGAGYMRTLVTLEAQRLNNWPMVPVVRKQWSYQAERATAYLENVELQLEAPQTSSDGNKLLYKARMKVWYAWDRVLQSRLPLCGLPNLYLKYTNALAFPIQDYARVPMGENLQG